MNRTQKILVGLALVIVPLLAWAADTKISALTAVTSVAGTNEFAVNEAGTSKKATATQLRDFIGPTLISGASGTANARAAPSETWQILTSNCADNATTTIATCMTTSSLQAGTYWFRYDILGQSGTSTVSLKFDVQFSGTQTKHAYHLFFPSQGVTAATGIADQDINVTTGAVWAHESTRASGTDLGPLTDVDTINVDVHYVIEGVIVVTVAGNLLLGHASESASATRVVAGTVLHLRRFS